MSSKPLVLVTSLGYLGTSTTQALLDQGYRVRLALRGSSLAKARDQFAAEAEGGLVEFAQVDGLDTPGAYDEAIKGVDAVAHLASPVLSNPQDVLKDVLTPAIEGNLNILRAAEGEESVKAIVITSSIVAYHFPGTQAALATSDKLNSTQHGELTLEAASKLPTSPWNISYGASKVLAENAAWQFYEGLPARSDRFILSTVAPAWVLGPTTERIERKGDLRSSSQMTFNGLVDATSPAPAPRWMVDVRDVAAAHVGAITASLKSFPAPYSSTLSNKATTDRRRYLLASNRFSSRKVADTLRSKFPEQASRVATFEGEDPKDEDKMYNVESAPAEVDLGFKYHTFEETIVDWAEQAFPLKA